ncbi:DUF4276 family protein [Methylomagnum sp.]
MGEDKSDVETIKVLIHRLHEKHGIPKTQIRGTGYTGIAELLKHGARGLTSLAHIGCAKFVVVCDADQKDVAIIRGKISEKIIRPSKTSGCVCIVIAVQEIEAWLLADIQAVSQIFTGWKPKEIPSPESIASPKEYLEKLSRKDNGKPRYSHATHNPQLAQHVNLDLVSHRCQSFKPLENLIMTGKGNL